MSLNPEGGPSLRFTPEASEIRRSALGGQLMPLPRRVAKPPRRAALGKLSAVRAVGSSFENGNGSNMQIRRLLRFFIRLCVSNHGPHSGPYVEIFRSRRRLASYRSAKWIV